MSIVKINADELQHMNTKADYLIIGGGIIGMAIARALQIKNHKEKIVLIEKEEDIGRHASGRNSGVLHAGFYYTKDSLKAKLTAKGNVAMKEFCKEKKISVNPCGKLVVARNEEELKTLYELEKRGKSNGANVKIITAREAQKLEPRIKTFQKALYSPDTASVRPQDVCQALKEDITAKGVEVVTNCQFKGYKIKKTIGDGETVSDNGIVRTTRGNFQAKYVINAAGLYADKVAHSFGFGKEYSILPFKGLYLPYYGEDRDDIKMHIYPVPLLANPFLGVHFTKMADGSTKIGPTAILALWREQYGLFRRFRFGEFLSILYYASIIFLKNKFNFRALAIEEARKYFKTVLVKSAADLAEGVDPKDFGAFTKPGIRAQLLHKRSLSLVQDFVIEGDDKSIHILNAVSPAFTCAFPFAELVVDMIKEKKDIDKRRY